MHIGVYGSGYLGTVVSACLADFGTPVTCFDENTARINGVAQGNIPFFEKNLQDVVRRNVRAGRLIYSTDLASFAAKSQAIFMAEDSHHYIEEAALKLARLAAPHAILVIVTPVPVGTAARIEQKLKGAGLGLTVVSHPIFVTDGCAVEDFNWPDRIVLGTASPTPCWCSSRCTARW